MEVEHAVRFRIPAGTRRKTVPFVKRAELGVAVFAFEEHDLSAQIRHHRAVAAFRDLKKRRIFAGSDKTENFACRRSGARRFAAATNLSTNDRASRASLMQKFAVMLDVAIPIFLSFR